MFFQKLCFSSNLVSLCQFQLIQSIFRSIEILLNYLRKPLFVSIDRNCFSIDRNCFSIYRNCFEIVLKFFNEPLSVSIDRNYFSINRNSWIRFFKNSDLTCSKHFFKTFQTFFSLSPTRQGSTEIFCRFPPFFLQGFSLPKPVCLFCTSFCIYFHVFMHKLMHFCGIFGIFQNWDFFGINPLFLKLIIGFCSYIDIFMSYVG